jgi:hypothetical protein
MKKSKPQDRNRKRNRSDIFCYGDDDDYEYEQKRDQSDRKQDRSDRNQDRSDRNQDRTGRKQIRNKKKEDSNGDPPIDRDAKKYAIALKETLQFVSCGICDYEAIYNASATKKGILKLDIYNPLFLMVLLLVGIFLHRLVVDGDVEGMVIFKAYNMRPFLNGLNTHNVQQLGLKARFNGAADVEFMMGDADYPDWLLRGEAAWVVYPDTSNESLTETSLQEAFNEVIRTFREEYGSRGTVVDFDIDPDSLTAQTFSKLIRGRYAMNSL